MNHTTTNNSRKSRESEFPPTEESGLQTPPTRDTPIKESGLQNPPTRDTPIPTRDITIKNRGYKTLLQRETPPTRDTPIQFSVTPLTSLVRG